MTPNPPPNPFGTSPSFAGSSAPDRNRARRRVRAATGSVGALALLGSGALALQLASGATATAASAAVTAQASHQPAAPQPSTPSVAPTQPGNTAPLTTSGGS